MVNAMSSQFVKSLGHAPGSQSIVLRFMGGASDLSQTQSVHTGSQPHSCPIQWTPYALSPRIKRPEREADHPPSHPYIMLRLRMSGALPTLPSVPHEADKDNFTFEFIFTQFYIVSHSLPNPAFL